MSTDALDPAASPSELNNTPRARRLSKLPAIIIMGVALLVVSLLGYSILTRGQPKDVAIDDEVADEVGTTLFSANDIIQGQDKSFFERPVLPDKTAPAVADSKPEIPELTAPKVEVEKAEPNAPSRRNNPVKPNTDVATMSAEEKFAEKVARAKEQLLLDALGAKTLAASAPDVKEEAGSNAVAVAAPVALGGAVGGRDRAREEREIRERLAGQQTSPDLERIASLLSTIAENTSQQAKPATLRNQGGTQRLSGMEALASLSQGNGSASRLTGNNGSASRQSIGIGRLSESQKDLLALAENSPPGTFIEAKRIYGYSTEVAREQLTDTDLRIGTIIPAILINGINSELEGVAIAQVSQNVWDSTHGEHVLIPQGTKLIGDFKSDIKEGQSRVGVSWNRLQFPDGKTLALTNMVGSDQAGYTGFSDMVNNHYKKKFGSATLLSIISGLGSMFAADNENQTSGEAFTNQLAQQYGTVGSSMIEKNLEIPPTIIIRPGYRFNVIVTQDFALKPYY